MDEHTPGLGFTSAPGILALENKGEQREPHPSWKWGCLAASPCTPAPPKEPDPDKICILEGNPWM